ncbi:MAG: hypothetical protein K1000chlam3_00800 [Chlamydiae bacterium]|nr:hypothetical protein [Chlamydiota bacterium]
MEITLSSLWSLVGFGSNNNNNDEKVKEEKDPNIVYNNEFTELYHEFINDIALFRDKYPLTSVITMVVFAIFGISSFFSFNFTGIVSSVLYCTTSYCLGKSIGNKGIAFWSDIKNSLFEVFQASSRNVSEKKEKPAEA